MSESLKRFLQRWLINTVAVMVAAKIVPGIECDSITTLFAASLLLGILNASLRPLLWRRARLERHRVPLRSPTSSPRAGAA